jgi:hypothetical protein
VFTPTFGDEAVAEIDGLRAAEERRRTEEIL